MNKARRNKISDSILALKGAQERLCKAMEEEKIALARIPDTDENEERREAMDEIITGLEDTLSSLGDAIDTLEGADF